MMKTNDVRQGIQEIRKQENVTQRTK